MRCAASILSNSRKRPRWCFLASVIFLYVSTGFHDSAAPSRQGSRYAQHLLSAQVTISRIASSFRRDGFKLAAIYYIAGRPRRRDAIVIGHAPSAATRHLDIRRRATRRRIITYRRRRLMATLRRSRCRAAPRSFTSTMTYRHASQYRRVTCCVGGRHIVSLRRAPLRACAAGRA